MVACSDAFEQVWPEIAGDHDLELVRATRPEEAAGARPLACILACGGAEAHAVDHLHAALRAGLPAPLVVGAAADHRLAVQLLRAGAESYFALPGDLERLSEEIARRAARPLDPPSDRSGYDFSSIVGDHPTLRGAIDRLSRLIPGGRATVLILGETGTGKELFAHALHDNGPRARAPFVDVNCSAIPANLLESELFGHEKGAFTDARTAKPGLFELADGGTLFLDEVSAMPIELQAKLLRFLETRELRRVGGVRTTTVDVRVVAAGNEDLRALIAAGRFREDLYYRLAVVPIHLPPLRERGDDVIALARHFLGALAASYGVENARLSPKAESAIRRHPWPGNVRELRNAVERGLLLSGGGEIGPEDLSLESAEPGTASAAVQAPSPIPFPATIEEIEVAAAAAALERYDGNKSEAARVLGITRSRLYRLLRRGEDDPVSRDDTPVA